jgi:hypothetical protein
MLEKIGSLTAQIFTESYCLKSVLIREISEKVWQTGRPVLQVRGMKGDHITEWN